MDIIPYRDEWFDRYAAFARRSWGGDSYQHSRNYIDWLYRDNPSPDKHESDFLLAVDGEQIIGCIHKMRLPWRVGEKTVEIPALHNLIVDEAHRDGTGFMLILRAQGNHEHILIPGVAKPLSEVYVKLKYQRVKASWYRKVVRPVATAMRLVQKRFKISAPPRYFDARIIETLRLSHNNIRATLSPDETALSHIATTLNERAASYAASPKWDVAWLRWRFFHPRGPRHCLVQRDTDFLLLSLGPRHGLNAGRIIDASATSADSLGSLLQSANDVLRKSSAHVLLCFSADTALNEMLTARGWISQTDPIDTYFYHKKRKEVFETYNFHASAGDFGFEAIAGLLRG
jgi:hypothetical protein